MEIKLTFEEEGFAGHVLMRVANIIDRLKLGQRLGPDVLKKAADDDSEESKAEIYMNNLSSSIKLIEESQAYYEHVDLIKDGKEYHSFEDLIDDPSCQPVVMSCATKALMGLGEAGKK
jgi:hypothetical protein